MISSLCCSRRHKFAIKPHNVPRRHRGVVVVYFYSFFNLGIRWEWVVHPTPRPLYRRGRDPVPVVQGARWTRGPVWTAAEKNLPPPGFDPRTVQSVARSYSDCAIASHFTKLSTVTCSSSVHTERIVAFILQRWSPERAVILRYTYSTQLVLVCKGWNVPRYSIRI